MNLNDQLEGMFLTKMIIGKIIYFRAKIMKMVKMDKISMMSERKGKILT